MKNPDNRYRPIPFWSWNDQLEINELVKQIQWMHDNGIGGFFMHARSGLKTPYLSEEWMDCIQACCDTAEKLGMDAWAYDENGFPSGFVGGKLLEDPEYRDMYILHTQGEFDATADVSYVIGESTLQRTRQPQSGKEHLNLYLRRSASTVDILNPKVTEKFLKLTHEYYHTTLKKPYFQKLKGFFTDEPQYYRAGTPYTPMLTAYFQEHYQTDVFDGLGLLFVEKEGYRTFRYRYWLAMQQLMLKNFAAKVYHWCDEAGTRLTGHYVEETSLGAQLMCCGGAMPFYEYEHIPGIDWLGKGTSNELSSRQLGSAAAQLGKSQTLTETFGCCGWDVTPSELYRIAGFQFATGANLLCHHLIPYSEGGLRKRDHPAHFIPLNPWIDTHFKDFNDYFSRLGQLLSESTEPVNVAMLHPMRSAYFEYKRSVIDPKRGFPYSELDDSLQDACRFLSSQGIAFHFLDETLLEKYGFVDGQAIGCGQCAYTYLILPKLLTMGRHTQKLLQQFTKNGGKVLLLDDAPRFLEGEPFCHTYLKTNCTLEEILAAQPFHVADNHTELYYTYRSHTEGSFLFVQNASAERTYTQTFDFGSSIHSFCAVDLITLEQTQLPLTVTIPENEALLLYPSTDPAPVCERKAVYYLPRQEASVTFGDNYLTVDHLRYSLDGTTYSDSIPCMKAFRLLLEQRYEGPVWLRYEFEIETLPETLTLYAEAANGKAHFANGIPFTFCHQLAQDGAFWQADITPYLRIGQNTYETVIHWHQSEQTYYALFGENVTESLKNCLVYDSEIEAVYLAGHFGVYTHEPYTPHPEDTTVFSSRFYIGKPPAVVTEPTLEGLPFFRGALTMTQQIYVENTDLLLKLHGTYLLADITVNGQYAGQLFLNRELDISAYLTPGANQIAVTYLISNRNLLGPFHSNWPESYICPATFEAYDFDNYRLQQIFPTP